MQNSTPIRFIFALLLGASAATGFVACGDDEDKDDDGVATVDQELGAALQSNYAAIVRASYEDSITAAQSLDTALDTFVADPTEANMEAARQAWLDSREPYLQTEVYRFYEGPIDNEEDGPEGLLNAWPMDENFVDYTEDEPSAGIINDDSITIDAATLVDLNGQDREENVATGYHAIEFLLWGQDFNTDGPGDRPVGDYTADQEDGAPNEDRRALYLTTASELMISHLEQVNAEWAEGAENYRAEFTAATPEEGLRRIMTGMIILSGFETGGERLQAALDSGDQEDEHSCFSDNTHRDMIQDVVGIQNVWLGTYSRLDGSQISGTGVRDVVAAADADLATQITEQIAESLRLANALQTPFDNEIAVDNAEGRARVEALITSLRAQEDLLEEAFLLFGLTIPVAE